MLEETIGRIQAVEAKAAAAAADAKAEAAELVRRAQQDAATVLAQETAEAEARTRAARPLRKRTARPPVPGPEPRPPRRWRRFAAVLRALV